MPGNHPLELNRAVPGGRVEMFAVEDDEIEFRSITAHIARFLREVAHLTDIEDTNHD